MVLSHQPSGDVTVTVNNPTDNSEVTATPRTLTFTTENWHAPQTVTVAAVHDGDAADDSATVTHGVADGGYDGVSVPDVAVTVDDDETVSIVLSKTDPDGGGGGRRRRDLYGEAVPRAVGRGDGDGDRPGHHRPYAERSERDGHPDLQHDHLERCADGDGEGRRGHRRQERRGDPGTHRLGRRVRGRVKADLAVTVDDDETVSIVLSKTDLTVDEEDATGQTYTVKLSHEPSVEVTVTVTGQDHHRPYAERSERDRYPDLQHDHLERCADGDGEGRERTPTRPTNDQVTLTHTGAQGASTRGSRPRTFR